MRVSRFLSTASLCAIAAALANPVLAQTVQPPKDSNELAEIVVVAGTRQALEAGVAKKRNSVQFVESVVAEDIGKLPDYNVAESLQRVPGIQVTQGIGEGTSITVRGSRDNVYLLNGRSLVDVAGRGGTGLDTLGTSTYGVLSVIPAELIARLDVTKLPGADEIEGALGGTVDIQTRKPLDQKPTLFSGSAEWNQRSLGDREGKRVSFLASKRNDSRTFGALVNVVYSQSEIQQDSFNSFSGYQRISDTFNNNTRLFPAGRPNPLALYRIADFRYQTLLDKRDRLGVSTTVQWAPMAGLDLYVDSTYANTKSDRTRDWFAAPTSSTPADYRSVEISPDGYLVGAEIGLTPPATTLSVRPTLNKEFAILDSTLSSTAAGGTYKGDGWKVFAEVAYTNAESDIHQVATTLTTASITNYTFKYNGVGQIPTVTLPSLDLTNPANIIWQGMQDNVRNSKTEDTSIRFDVDRDINQANITTLEFGGRYETLNYLLTPKNASLTSTVGAPLTGFNVLASATPDAVQLFSNPDFLSGVNFPRNFVTASRTILDQGCSYFLATYTQAQKDLCQQTTPTREQISGVDEKIFASYFKLNFDADVGFARIQGNAGARYVTDSRVGTGFILYNNFVPTVPGGTTGTVVREFTANRVTYKDHHFLPSVVAKVSLPYDIVVRAGAARVIARPATNLLNAGLTITEPTTASGLFSGSGGNTKLKPYLVDQVDLAAEWYFAKGSLLSLAAFYKDVKTYFVRQSLQEVVPGYNNDQPFSVSRTQNYNGATVKGLEFTYQQQYDFLPAPLDGFGSQFTYSYIESVTPTIDPVTKEEMPLPGLSKNSYNAVVYYEKGRVSFRVAYNWRDKYFDSIGSNGSGIYYDEYSNLAASARYSFDSRTRLTLSVNNIEETPLIRFNGKKQYIQSYEINPRVLTLSLSKSF